ncbi:hypothetical protein PF005_g8935 [Phytophthora fragariae]|uniref:Uncharacterized protein n=1 Tax=Phytophthora fragariae TaxID=53985 RepID=A0A6A3YD69_9STRA|nr:hypothetical protein PF005_g8935 [Phytophthora fragariae]
MAYVTFQRPRAYIKTIKPSGATPSRIRHPQRLTSISRWPRRARRSCRHASDVLISPVCFPGLVMECYPDLVPISVNVLLVYQKM